MRLQFEKPIVFFDLETTGTDIVKDRICSISAIKVQPNGTTEELDLYVNPEMPIHPEATKVHGITNEFIQHKPIFKDLAPRLMEFFKGCDMAGFNSNHFDIPLLAEEFGRCGIDMPEKGTKFIDVFRVYQKMEPRDLSSAVKYYLGEDHSNAHNSLADIQATLRVFCQQLTKYESLTDKTVDEITSLYEDKKRLDFSGHFLLDEDGDAVYGSGKDKGKKVKMEPSFAQWMLGKSHYTSNTKRVARELIEQAYGRY